MKIEVKVVVCDWGIFINGELSKDLIFNSKANAEEVKRIIELDIENKRFDSVHQKVNITKGEDRMLNQFRKASFIDIKQCIDNATKALQTKDAELEGYLMQSLMKRGVE